jgi:HEAT repeat protein
VGPESIPTIVAILNDKSRPDRADTLSVLAIMGPRFGTNASLVVSAVIGCMQEQNVEVAVEAAQTLSLLHFELEANDVVPALVAGLDHPSLRVQVASAEALGAFGQDARSAVPALEKISANSHADPAVRDMAQRVLREVLGTNAVHLE